MNPAEITQELPPLEFEEQVECEALANLMLGNVSPEQSLYWKSYGLRIGRA